MSVNSGAVWQGLNDTVVNMLADKLADHKLWDQTSRLLAEAMPDLVSASLLMTRGGKRQLEHVAGEFLSIEQIRHISLSLRQNPRAGWLAAGAEKSRYFYGTEPFQLAAGSVLCCLVIACDKGGEEGAPLPKIVSKMASRLRLLLDNIRLESTVARLHRALDEGPAAMILLDSQRRIEYVNPVFSEVTGFSPADVLGRPVEVLNSQQLGNASFSPEVWQSVALHKIWQMETLQRRKDGEHYWAETRISSIHDDHGDICQYFVLQNDFTEARLFSAKLSYDSAHDSVTGLINRHQFELHLEEILASVRSFQGRHALLYMDLDEFKVINDTCGHAAGDELLRQIALLVRETIGNDATFSRLGGDEFAVLLEDTPA
jgi:PAS domain S-box-containing protein